MAKVQITNVTVLDNPSPFQNPIQFEITFECIEDLTDDLEWKIIYVGSAESEEHDQTLDSVLVGPVPSGRHMFVFQGTRALARWCSKHFHFFFGHFVIFSVIYFLVLWSKF